ncbi:hypothetical protein GYMLUDRAFT_250589 [Collybiopsis luxurians FD-317 M1]|uniref:Uncharacterized protein n=1 Tax=Collybiopsis luxurians FD-317 M1 TaxID=944289 RepID=A0A0D0BU79_9AGAR|nr:hypothetical protein GYMLUDRAFT_250589 [Collybiopsis luxurians FD-317 M1]
MPLLTELCLEAEFTNDEYEEDEHDRFALEADKFSKSTPKLEHLSLSGIHFMDVQDISELSSASSLRDITLRSIKFEQVLSVMNAASANTTLELRDISFNGEGEDSYGCSSRTLKVIAPHLDLEEEGNPLSLFFKNLTEWYPYSVFVYSMQSIACWMKKSQAELMKLDESGEESDEGLGEESDEELDDE